MISREQRYAAPLASFISEYTERNTANEYRPVAVGKYGIRARESIYSKELAKDYSKNKLIYKNTLTVGMGSAQIDIGILTDDVVFSVSPAYHTYHISQINSQYLDYCLQYRNQDMFLRFVKRGSRQGKAIDIKRWILYEIPVYESNVQYEIVRNLNLVKSIIKSRNQQLIELDTLVKARFVEMFGDPEFNVMDWPVSNMSELCTVGSSKRIYQNEQTLDGIPFLRISNFTNLINTGKTTSDLFISESRYKELCLQGQVPITGDILLTSRGTLGQCYIVGEEDKFYFQDGMITWLSKYSPKILPLYISYLFSMPGFRKQIDSMQAGSTVSYLSIAMIKRLKVMVPDLSLQEQFASFVTQIDKSKVVVQKALDEAQLLFDSLMQQYFG